MGEARPYYVLPRYSFLAYPNRDSLPFHEAYRIPEAHTVIRGSLRYEGNPALVKALIDLGWINVESKPWLKDGMTWAQIQQQATGASSSTEIDLVAKIDQLCSFSSPDEREKILSGLRWMGLFSNQAPTVHENLLDTLSAQLTKLCNFQPGERDLVVLQHKFVVERMDGSKVNTEGLLLLPRPLAKHYGDRILLHPLLSSSETLTTTRACPRLLESHVGSPRRCCWTDSHP
jgi:saccharopine dehydrogenase-like NADP-dependent oxidoreductase